MQKPIKISTIEILSYFGTIKIVSNEWNYSTAVIILWNFVNAKFNIEVQFSKFNIYTNKKGLNIKSGFIEKEQQN
jgi:hypothetical protein